MKKATQVLIALFLICVLTGHVCANGRTNKPIQGPSAKYIKYVAIHHTEVRASDNGHQLDSVNSFHKERFADCSFLGKWGGYNYFCDVDGTLTQFRLIGEKTAAQLAHNFDTISICLAGNFNEDMPTKPQIRTLVKFLYEYPDLTIVFHRDLADRTCPGRRITKQWLRSILANGRRGHTPPLHVHMGIPDLHAGEDVLISREHEQDRQMYRELEGNDSEIAIFQRQKLRIIIQRFDERRYLKRRRH